MYGVVAPCRMLRHHTRNVGEQLKKPLMKESKETKKKNWKSTDNRFVGFLDILGFKDLVMRKTHDEIYDILYKISKTKKQLEELAGNEKIVEKFGDAEVKIVNFSDSIVIFSKNDDIGNFRHFCIGMRWLFAKCIKDGIPLKGGFAHGQVSINQKEQIYFGQPLIDAYLIEEDVNYFGIVAHNSIDNYIKLNEDLLGFYFLNFTLFDCKTCLKSGVTVHKNVNWFRKLFLDNKSLSEKECKENIIKVVEGFRISISGSPRRYIDNTLSMLNNVKIETLRNEPN